MPIRGRYNSTFVNEVRSASNQCTCVLIRIETCDWLTRFEKPRDLHTAFYRVRPDPLANHTPLNARGSGVSRLTARRPPKPRALSPTNTLANCSEGLACEARRFEVCAKAYGWDADARRAHLPEGPRLGSVRALRGARN